MQPLVNTENSNSVHTNENNNTRELDIVPMEPLNINFDEDISSLENDVPIPTSGDRLECTHVSLEKEAKLSNEELHLSMEPEERSNANEGYEKYVFDNDMPEADLEKGLGLKNLVFKEKDKSLEEGNTFDLESVLTEHGENVRDNPFAKREGKSLTWRSINMTVSNKKGKKVILDNVYGEVPKQKMTAILGPSGAGKTSLLNILAGRTKTRGSLAISTDIRLNNYPVNPTKMSVRKQIAFVAQDDSLQITATPRECIRFSAKLRLSRKTSDDEIDNLVETMLVELGLSQCADTLVGGPLLKGISGGERKRTSVGVELVVKPSLVFLDEPTSGLDSYSALQVVQVLKKVADAGASVLFTIHQPSSEVFNSFDFIMLMNKGRVMFQGELKDVNSTFAKYGHPIPPNYNPADWIMHIAQAVSVPELEEKGFFPQDRRIFPNPATDMNVAFPKKNQNHYQPACFKTQLKLLLQRDWKDLIRNTKVTGARYGIAIVLSSLVATLFYEVGKTPLTDLLDFQSHFGALMIVFLLAMFGTALPALIAFPDERPVFLREYSTNHYSVFSYFGSRFIMEALNTFSQIAVMNTIVYWTVSIQMSFIYLFSLSYIMAMGSTALAVLVGASLEDPKLGYQVLPVVFVPQLLLSGFFVSTDLIPQFIQFTQYFCPLMYAIRLGLLAEFSDCGLTCRLALSKLNAREDEVWWYWLALISLFVNIRIIALYVLKRKASRFL